MEKLGIHSLALYLTVKLFEWNVIVFWVSFLFNK